LKITVRQTNFLTKFEDELFNNMATATKYKIKDEKSLTVEDLFNPYNVGARPFLKWAGGKGQLLDKFQDLYPKQLKQKR